MAMVMVETYFDTDSAKIHRCASEFVSLLIDSSVDWFDAEFLRQWSLTFDDEVLGDGVAVKDCALLTAAEKQVHAVLLLVIFG